MGADRAQLPVHGGGDVFGVIEPRQGTPDFVAAQFRHSGIALKTRAQYANGSDVIGMRIERVREVNQLRSLTFEDRAQVTRDFGYVISEPPVRSTKEGD